MSLQQQEQDELAELVEEQSDVIKEMAITQNAILSLLLDKHIISNEELAAARADILKALDQS